MYDWLPIDIAASAMTAERIRMNVLASNLANINSTRTEEGGPYQPLEVIFESAQPGTFQKLLEKEFGQFLGQQFSRQDIAMLETHLRGVTAKVVQSDRSPDLRVEPNHPDADPKTGLVAYPSISPIESMTNMIAASRMYEANSATIRMSKQMIEALLTSMRS
jgi:flagellar basal-body rod protein FlgC